VTHPINAKLAAEVVAASINLLNIIILRVFAENQRELFTTGGIYHKFALQVFLNEHRGENCMPRVFFLGIFVCMR
jgi:hypothetical protein